MIKSDIIQCPAKVNLSLDVTNRRSDGYHNLKTIMHTVNLFDTLEISVCPSNTSNISVTCNSPYVPNSNDNICAKAATAFLAELGTTAEINIGIKKKIPVGAGLGGGSSNAASTLKLLNKLFDKPFTDSYLAKLSASIGADVPFFLYGGCMLAEGIGEVLTPLPKLKNITFLIAKPNFGVSTPWVYKNLNLDQISAHPNTSAVINAIKTNDIDLLSSTAGNLLEEVTLKKYPEIGRYKNLMKSYGANYSLMSGSGSSVFGIFTDPEKAAAALDKFKAITDQVYLA